MKTSAPVFFTILLAFFLFGMNSPLLSQRIELPSISKLSTQEGLSSNIIYSVLQDNKGFIWIATEQGLNKFDGKNLTQYATGKGRYSLSHNRTQTMLLSPDNNIWAGTSDGLNIYDYKSDSIIKIRTDSKPYGLVYNDITVLAAGTTATKTWLGTYGNGVNYFDWDQKQFLALALPKLPNVAEPLNVMSLLEDDTNRLWIGTQSEGLYRYDLKEKKLEYYELQEEGRFVRVIYQDSFRRIWVGTSKGCFLYNETTNRLEQVVYPNSLTNTSVGAIREDRNGKLWIGSELYLMSFSVRAFSMSEHFAYQMFEYGESISRLSCPSVNSLFADQENNIWIGTAWGGINMLKGTSAKFLLFKHDADVEKSLPNSPLNAICTDNMGHLFIGTMGTGKVGLCTMDLATGVVNEMPINRKFPNYVYQSMMFDSGRTLWIGTYNRGLIRVAPDGVNYSQFLVDPVNSNSLPGNDVRAIYESKNHLVWIGTNNGLAVLDPKSNRISRINLSDSRSIAVRSIKEDSNGLLWVGTYGDGIITYNHKTGEIKNPMQLFPRIVHDVFINKDVVWMATNGEGLVMYNIKTKESHIYNEQDGLLSNYLASVLCDNAGHVWVGNSKGIMKFNPHTKEVVNFSSGDGLQPREFSEHGAILLANGSMVFAGFEGLNIFDPLNVTKDDKCPPVIFTKLLVSNELITPSENKKSHSPLNENITLTDKIELKHNQSVFTIEFMGVNYNANQKIQYAYLLEGSDKQWNQLGHQNSVTFRNLSPGTYVFKVKASSPDAVWNDSNIVSLTIVIHPPFWASVWAYLFYSVLLLILFYFVGLFIIIRIEAANNLKIERARREKDEELHQEKLQFFTNISHELRTPLTLIIGPLETMQSDEIDEEKRMNFMLMLHNAKRLLAMVNQLLDFRKAEKGQMKLRVQFADIIASLHEIMVSFDDLKKQKEIQFEFIHHEEKIMAWFDAEFINKSTINLITNAFKFTPKGGVITIMTEVSNDSIGNRVLAIFITDNGKGISSNDLPYIFDRFYQGEEKSTMQQGSGIGLHLVKNLIELHHGEIDVESYPNVKTTFCITIPIEKSAYLKEEFMDETEASQKQNVDVSGLIHIDIENDTHENEKKNRDTRKKVLIVEDNADIRNYIRGILGISYAIEEAENGLIGLEMIKLHEFDLVISDIMMPEMDGIEMCKQMKASVETDHIPIILLTAKSDIENRIEGLRLGADSYITKPFHPQHLTIRVAKLIELRDLLKERYSRKILLGELHNPETKTDSPEEQFLQKTISTILEKMIESEFNGDILAADLNISRMGLHRKIKALTGQTTGEFIRNIRLKKASELLSIDGKNISEVCYSVGFNSPSYFTTCFTEVYKMTPTEYVKSMKG